MDYSQAILGALGESVTVIDKDLRIVWVNPVVEKWAGPLVDLVGKYCYMAYPKRDNPCENCPTLRAFKSGKIEKAAQSAYDTNGDIMHFEYTSAPIRDSSGKIIAVVELAVDLTDQVKLQQILTETKNSLQSIFHGIADSIAVIDTDYMILRANRAMLTMFEKRDYPELVGKKCYKALYNKDNICDNCPAESTILSGESCNIGKYYCVPGKEKRVIDIVSFPIKNDNGRVIQVILYKRDVSNSVKLDDCILNQEKIVAIGELAAGIAHEIRNPLAIISASAELILYKYEPNEFIKPHLLTMLKSSQNANRIVSNLLNFTKPNEGCFKLGSIVQVMDQTCNLVRAKCLKQGIRMVKHISRGLPLINMDKNSLEGVFVNFMLNAIEAMPNGGRLGITAYADTEHNQIVIQFSDTGCGISRENLPKLILPFYTTKEDGTGLGLYLANGIILQHNGSLEFESQVGEGTKITVKLPILRETAKTIDKE